MLFSLRELRKLHPRHSGTKESISSSNVSSEFSCSVYRCSSLNVKDHLAHDITYDQRDCHRT